MHAVHLRSCAHRHRHFNCCVVAESYTSEALQHVVVVLKLAMTGVEFKIQKINDIETACYTLVDDERNVEHRRTAHPISV